MAALTSATRAAFRAARQEFATATSLGFGREQAWFSALDEAREAVFLAAPEDTEYATLEDIAHRAAAAARDGGER